MSLKEAFSHEGIQHTPAQLGYFNAHAQSKAHATVLDLFSRLADEEGLARAFLARRLGKKSGQITRWLGAPGNWTLETLTNLLLAMGHEPIFEARPLNDIPRGNYQHPAAFALPPQETERPKNSRSRVTLTGLRTTQSVREPASPISG